MLATFFILIHSYDFMVLTRMSLSRGMSLARVFRKVRANTLAECHCVLRGVLIHLQVERCV